MGLGQMALVGDGAYYVYLLISVGGKGSINLKAVICFCSNLHFLCLLGIELSIIFLLLFRKKEVQ